MRVIGLLLLAACVTDEAARRPASTEVEGLIRQRARSCGGTFVMALATSPVAGARFSIHAGGTIDGPEVASVVTSDEGAFRATLPPGLYCFADTTDPSAAPTCTALLQYDPKVEPVPIVMLPAVKCR